MSDTPEKKKNSKFRVIRFALTISLICSLLITASAVGLKKRQLENMALDKKINLLSAANLIPEGRRPKKEAIQSLFDAHIRKVAVDNQGSIVDVDDSEEDKTPGTSPAAALSLYLVTQDDLITGYIIPINTRGLWGKIQGYLAFENDGETVAGFSVFSHSETPGLGGEIESNWFKNNFKGKKILNSQDQFVSVKIAKGKTENLPENLKDHYVDGISGATLTGKYLSEGIKDTLLKYDAVSVTFRQKQLTPQKTDP